MTTFNVKGRRGSVTISVDEYGSVEVAGANNILAHMQTSNDQKDIPVDVKIHGPTSISSVDVIFERVGNDCGMLSPRVTILNKDGDICAESHGRLDDNNPSDIHDLRI